VSQPSKDGTIKERLIFCPPFAVTILELFFYSKLCSFFTRNDGSSIVMGNSQMFLYNLNIQKKDSFKTSGDYSSYDQTLPSILICASMFLFSELIDFESNPYFKNLFWRLNGYIMYGHCYHTSIGLQKRKRGIFSGTVITNLADGVCNLMLVSPFLSGSGSVDIRVGGDDIVIFSENKVNTELISEGVLSTYDMKLNFLESDKYNKGDPSMQFLGSKWTVSGPERPLMRMVLGCCIWKSK
jgi:hypothetical protein